MATYSYVIEQIKTKFSETGAAAEISLLKGDCFKATLTEGGVTVDNLGNMPFLPWVVFEQAVKVMEQNNGIAKRGNAMDAPLGYSKLPLDSIEGHIASVVYGRKCGDTVFRRITPIACILIWAGICEPKPGKLSIVQSSE